MKLKKYCCIACISLLLSVLLTACGVSKLPENQIQAPVPESIPISEAKELAQGELPADDESWEDSMEGSPSNGQDDSLETRQDAEENLTDDSLTEADEGEIEASNDAVQTKQTAAPEENIIEYNESQINEILAQQPGRYYYDALPESQKHLYGIICRSVRDCDVAVLVNSLDVDEIGLVFQCVMADHPEYFYIKGYHYVLYSAGDTLNKITFTPELCVTTAEIPGYRALVEAYAQTALAGMPEADAYAKCKYIYEYLILHTEYDASVSYHQNLLSVVLYNRSVCQGYAKMMQFLLQRAGIPVMLVTGKVSNGQNHAWNMVRIGDAWYHVDPTWGDVSYQGNVSGHATASINYDYLCMTTEMISRNHEIVNPIPIPQAVSMADNYFVREGMYLQEYNEAQIAQIFQRGYDSGAETVMLKCSNDAVYGQVYQELIEQSGVSRFFQGEGDTISYSLDDKQFSMVIWLR